MTNFPNILTIQILFINPLLVVNKFGLHYIIHTLAGVGTGLGIAFLNRTDKDSQYNVFPSEGGAAQMPIYSDADK
jgi:hypothetical protein